MQIDLKEKKESKKKIAYGVLLEDRELHMLTTWRFKFSSLSLPPLRDVIRGPSTTAHDESLHGCH